MHVELLLKLDVITGTSRQGLARLTLYMMGARSASNHLSTAHLALHCLLVTLHMLQVHQEDPEPNTSHPVSALDSCHNRLLQEFIVRSSGMRSATVLPLCSHCITETGVILAWQTGRSKAMQTVGA